LTEEYRKLFDDPEQLGKTLVVGLDGQVIGDLMLAFEDTWAQREVAAQAQGVQAELGRTLDPAHQGLGYATEAVAVLIRLRGQRGVVAPDGTPGHAPGALRRQRVAAPLRWVARRNELRVAR
jgi:hypothetical protein